MTWIRSLVQRLGCSACRVLTLLGKGADDRCDCRDDEEASEEMTLEEGEARRYPPRSPSQRLGWLRHCQKDAT